MRLIYKLFSGAAAPGEDQDGASGAASLTAGRVAARFIEPMQCRVVDRLPEGPDWQYELKFDGYRALALKSAGHLQLMSRNQRDFAPLFPTLVRALERLRQNTMVDGEIVALKASGQPSFNLLQNHRKDAQIIVFYAFDLLMLSGRNLQHRSLDERRALLEHRVMQRLREPVRFSAALEAPAKRLIEAVRALGLEGLIAKRRRSLYEPGRRSGAWVKFKLTQGQELVIGGYTPMDKNFDAILVGYYAGDQLIQVARVRNGFVPASHAALFKRFADLQSESCPFANLPAARKGRWSAGLSAADMKQCRWLRPSLVAQIEFAEWTSANRLRHARFAGLREDRAAHEITRESA
jgi:DNA ligase D-like protein (predicted ligase)